MPVNLHHPQNSRNSQDPHYDIYVLRNLPKVGVGFFVHSGFYPDQTSSSGPVTGGPRRRTSVSSIRTACITAGWRATQIALPHSDNWIQSADSRIFSAAGSSWTVSFLSRRHSIKSLTQQERTGPRWNWIFP